MKKTKQYLAVRLNFLNWLAEYLYEQGVRDAEVWKLLQEAQLQVHSKQLEQLERALKKEHREVRRLRQRNQQLRLRIQDMNRQAQNGLNYRIRKLSKRFGLLRARLPGR
jgi:hypothetical protein